MPADTPIPVDLTAARETLARLDALARDGETRPQVVARVVADAHRSLTQPQEKP